MNKPGEHTREFICLICDGGEACEQPHFSTAAAFIGHCKERHPETVNAEGKVTARRTDALFLDGAGFYRNSWQWETGQGEPMAVEVQSGPKGLRAHR